MMAVDKVWMAMEILWGLGCEEGFYVLLEQYAILPNCVAIARWRARCEYGYMLLIYIGFEGFERR